MRHDTSIPGLFRSRHDRCYAACKLRTDPVYQAVTTHLRESDHPLLDIGCGIGLLAFHLRREGFAMPIHGLDYDPRKIDEARMAAVRSGEAGLRFAAHDAREGLPEHRGNVCILDILQFFTPGERDTLLRQAAERLAPGGLLIIRSGLRDRSVRFGITIAGDLLAKATRWMKAAPTDYPTAGEFRRSLSPFGSVGISPMWGATPFNNHLVVLRSRPPGSGNP